MTAIKGISDLDLCVYPYMVVDLDTPDDGIVDMGRSCNAVSYLVYVFFCLVRIVRILILADDLFMGSDFEFLKENWRLV